MAVALHGYPRFTKDIDFLIPSESLNRAKEVAVEAGFLGESGRIPFPDSDVYRILKIEGTEYRILDLLVASCINSDYHWLKQSQW
jgi:hypothetical protein